MSIFDLLLLYLRALTFILFDSVVMAETNPRQGEKPPEETSTPARETFPESVSELSEEDRRKYGYAIYPDRGEERPYSLSNILFNKKDTDDADRGKCQKLVYKAFSRSKQFFT